MRNFNSFLILLLIIPICFPILNLNTPFITSIILLTILLNSKKSLKFKKLLFVLFIWIFYNIILYNIGFSNSRIGNIIDDFNFFSLPLLYFFIQNKNEINNKVFYLIDSIIIINIIYNTVFLYFFPNYLEVYNFSGDIDYFKSLNLQSTNFVLFTYIFLSIKLYHLYNSIGNKKQIFLL